MPISKSNLDSSTSFSNIVLIEPIAKFAETYLFRKSFVPIPKKPQTFVPSTIQILTELDKS